MITLKNIQFAYRKGQTLFDGLELELGAGAIYGLLGKNGAGKTSLLKIISGALFPNSGQVEAYGFVPLQREPAFLSDLFFIPEEFPFTAQRIEQFAKDHQAFYPKFNQDRFLAILQEFDLDPRANLAKLSFGQKKKAILAFGIASGTRLLILDEPTNGLDIPSKAQFRKVIAEMIDEHRTVIISTHQVRDLGSLMDPVVIIDGGKVIFNASVEDISRKLSFRLVQSLQAPHDCLYHEQVPGGYIAIYPNDGSQYSEPELEILFNGIIQRKPALLAALA